MKELLLGVFKALLDRLTEVTKENADMRKVMLSQMAQNAELRGIIRETRLSIEALDSHLQEIGYYKKHGTDGPFSLVKKAIEPSRIGYKKWI